MTNMSTGSPRRERCLSTPSMHFMSSQRLRDLVPVRRPRKAQSVRLFRRFAVPAVFASAALLSACASDTPQNTLKPEGPQARSINSLAIPVFLIAIAIGIFVYGLILFSIVKFRRRGEDHVPKQVHGNTAAELSWTVAPAVLLAVIGVLSVGKIFEVAKDPKDALDITVIGHRWWWEYQYPQVGQMAMNPRISTIDDPLDSAAAKAEDRAPLKIGNVIAQDTPVISWANELVIPAGKKVRLHLTSGDVMHNYWVPKLAGKIYSIPGRINELTIEADANDAGKMLYGQCAEFCGVSHANMRFKVRVVSPAEFETWRTSIAAPAKAPTSELAIAGKTLFENGGGCSTCHWVEPNQVNDDVKIGPNLTHFAARKHFAGAIAENNTRNLTAWLRNPQEFKPGSRMVIRKLNDTEIEQLIAYLQSLKV
jgi:cytochrome c oxidase subunit II